MIKTLHRMYPAVKRPLAFVVESVTEDFSIANFDRLRAHGSAILSAEEKTVGDDKYIYNPSCLVNDGRSAWFKASWTPEDYPASRVVWSSDNAQVRFLGGNTGAEACVYTSASTVDVYTRLSLQFGDCPSARPSFGAKIVSVKKVRVHVVPIKPLDSSDTPRFERDVFGELNKIFGQCGIEFYPVEHEAVVYRKAAGIDASKKNSYDQLEGLSSETDGLIIYLASRLVGPAPAFVFEDGSVEIVASSSCAGETVAHEVGHCFRLNDIYCTSHENKFGLKNAIVAVQGTVSASDFTDQRDWNSGTGSRYYYQEQDRINLIPRFLMYGGVVDCAVDIPLGRVKGVRSEGSNAALFHDDETKVGLDDVLIYDYLFIEE